MGTHLFVISSWTWCPVVLTLVDSLALDAAGHVWSWGWNGKGQLGVPMAAEDGGCQQSCRPTRVPGLPRCRKIGAGHESSFAISADGVLFAFGAARGGASVTSSGERQAFGRGAAAGDTGAHDSLDLFIFSCPLPKWGLSFHFGYRQLEP